MKKNQKAYSTNLKFKIAMEATKGNLTLAEISQKFKLHVSQISKWKKHLLDYGPNIFEKDMGTLEDKKLKQENEELYQQIGKLIVERDFLKKTLDI